MVSKSLSQADANIGIDTNFEIYEQRMPEEVTDERNNKMNDNYVTYMVNI